MRWVRSAARPVLAVLAASASLIATGPLSAADQRQPPPGIDPLVAPIGLAPAPPADTPAKVRVDVTALSPRVVRTETTVEVHGRLTNTSDRRIDNVEVRLQRGDPIATDAKLREAMTQPPAAETVRQQQFQPVPQALDPGASTDFTVTAPVDELKLNQPGVYPILVNVNGRPAYGGPERLSGLNFLLPVLRGATPPGAPAGVTILWPLVDDHPRVLQQSLNKPALLSDDDLATSVATGGRLYSLLNAAKLAIGDNPAVASSMCYAVDGDLLATVKTMSDGYQVRTPDGQTVPGKGKDAAQRWLSMLRDQTTGQCVFALPYADADLSALSRAGDADLTAKAVERGLAKVAEVLQPVQPVRSVLWPYAGTISQGALADIPGTPVTVLANPDRIQGATGNAPYALGPRNRAVPIDQAISSALAGPADGSVSVQNGLATLAFRAVLQPARTVLIAPPRRWNAPAGEMRTFLNNLAALYSAHLAEPQVLQGLAADGTAGTASGLDYTEQDTNGELPASVLAAVSQSNTVQRDLLGAMHPDETTRVDPEEALISPVRTGLLRAASNSWRGNPDGAQAMATDVSNRLDDLRNQITINPPGPPITLASSNSPIPVRIGNSLPVAVTVQFVLSENAGIKADAIPVRQVQANGTATQFIPTELLRAGRFTVDVQLKTPGDSRSTTLGSPARFEISSTSYGTITVTVTSVAGGALVLLVGRRFYRRRRQRPDKEQIPA
jgi:hypothetical protein